MKMLVYIISETVNMVKAILPEFNYPVSSRKANLLSRIEKMYNNSVSGLEGDTKGINILRSINN